MAAVDLSDNDIDRLLSSAELSLASKPADQTAVLNGKQQPDTRPRSTITPTALVGKAGKENGDRKPELALRVPQLKSEKKVRARIHFPSATPMRKSYPKLE